MMWRYLLVLLIACGSHESKRSGDELGGSAAPQRPSQPSQLSGSSQPSRTHVVELPEPEVELPKELAFEVIDAGRGKRRVLRYALAAKTSHYVVRTELTTRELAGGVWHDPSKLPALTTALDVSVGGDGVVSWKPLAGAVEGTASTTAEAYLAPWQGLVGHSFAIPLDVRGRITALADHDASSDELVQRLLVTAVPLPAEPIGEGARWRVVTALRQQAAVLKQTATYTLVSARKRWRIAVDVQRLAEPQRIGDVELVAIVRRLTGTVEVDPARPLPVAGTLDVKSTVHVRGAGGENIVEDTGTVKLELKAAISSTSR